MALGRIPCGRNAVVILLVSHGLRAALCFSKVPTPIVSHDGDEQNREPAPVWGQNTTQLYLNESSRRDATSTPQQGDINPIYYLHVPQSGSGFATTVAHHACEDDIPDDILVSEPRDFFDTWASKCDRSKFQRFQSGHAPLTGMNDSDLAHVVVMLRDPKQRILSGYYDDLHDCWDLRKKYACNASNQFQCEGDLEGPDGSPVRDPNVIPPIEYGRCVENCTANMLTGKYCADSGFVNVDQAVEIVGKLGFVGITDEWELSVCLWHKKFGGRMLPAELTHASLGVVSAASGGISRYDAHALLGHWQPRADNRVFDAASERFWQEINAFGITKKGCEKETNWLIAQTLSNGQDRKELFPNINPIYYLHLPESGSGFATTVAHYACGDAIPDHVAVMEPGEFSRSWPTCDHSRFQRFRSGSDPLDMDAVSGMSHVVMMARDPSQRILSGYYNGLHDCWSLQKKYNCQTVSELGQMVCDGDTETADGKFVRNPDVISPVEYGQCVQNCTANMLTGRSCDERGEVNLHRAIGRVKQAGFVGLADEWALSVCLWHKRFGGRMLAAELTNVRPGVLSVATGGASRYDKRALLGPWLPKMDALVFEAVSKRFWEELWQYNVTREGCEEEAQELIRNESRVEVADVSVEIKADFDINPIYYLNVPQTGAGFVTTVAQHACKKYLNENSAILDPDEFFKMWEPKCSRSHFMRFQSGFAPLNVSEQDSIEHVVMIAREPSQRILSGYHDGLAGCESLRGADALRNTTPVDYSRCVENCTANMLTGRSCDTSGDVDVTRAVAMIDEIGFVGLDHERQLSVCLWHKRFGGKMLPSELQNLEEGVVRQDTEYDEAILLGQWRPDVDRLVFEAAGRRFWREVERFGVSRETCHEEAQALAHSQLEDSVYFGWGFDINPIYYLHVPESGSGFATTLARHACGAELAEDVAILEPSRLEDASTCDSSKFRRFVSGHDPLDVRGDADLAHVVMMVREPSQRVLSGYFNDLHECPDLRVKYNCEESSGEKGNRTYICDGDTGNEEGGMERNPEAIPPLEYAKCVENCTSNMITGRSCSDSGPVNADQAVRTVSKLGFVGLAEEWELSICLWHKRFGGVMLPAELERLRMGAVRSVMGRDGKYNVDGLLGSWSSNADTMVYEAAARRFWWEIERYEVDQEACERETNKLKSELKPARVVGVPSIDINPIFYLHVPGSGSGFATTVAHHACGRDIPDDLAVLEPSDFLDNWAGACNRSRFRRFQSGHTPLEAFSENLAHVVVMFREPSQRILSGYFNDLHDCAVLQSKYGCSTIGGEYRCDGDALGRGGQFMRDPSAIPPVEYGSCVENCTANMLTGRSCSDPGEVDVPQAVAVINELGFVGLTDEWELSLCLWHRMFGGRMVPAELTNVRAGSLTARTHGFGIYDQHALLGSWRPSADLRVFDAATKRFWSDVDRFGVNQDSCDQEIAPLVDGMSKVQIVGSKRH